MRAALLLLASAFGSEAATYYIAASGNDNAAGTSPSSAWASLTQLSAHRFLAGDSVLLRQGDTFVAPAPFNLTTLPSPFTLSSYSDPASPAYERPLITRAPSAGNAGVLVNVHGSAGGITVEGVTFLGGESGLGFTWWPTPGQQQTLNPSGFLVQDCLFTLQTGAHYNASNGAWWASSISFARGVTAVPLEALVVANVTLRNNIGMSSDTFYQNSLNAVTFPSGSWTRAYVAGLNIQGNAIYNNSFNTVFLDTTSFVTVQGNVFHRNTPQQLFEFGTTDIIMGSLNASCSVIGNELGWRGEYQPGGPDGCALDFETNPTGVTIAGNYFHHSYGAGIMVFGHTVGPRDVQLLDNTFLWCGCNQTRSDHGGIAFMSNSNNASGVVSGNTLLSCPGVPALYVNMPGADEQFLITNNTIDGVNGASVRPALTPVVTQMQASNGIALQAVSPTPGVLRYTTDGSKPTASSAVWPSSGILTLPPRTVAVFVKTFPADQGMIESPAEGGVYAPM